MNCANHPDRERQAFCQNCGKPLCRECARVVGQAVFCEPCLEARLAAANSAAESAPFAATAAAPTPGATTYQDVPAAGPQYPYPGTPDSSPYNAAGFSAPTGTPNPLIAAFLGFIPGVGAMYNGQYAKGIVHLVIFAILVSLADNHSIFGLFVAFWVFYQAVEAYHTARARRDGSPLPNPFGLNDVGERFGFGRNWPSSPAAGPSATPSSTGWSQPPSASSGARSWSNAGYPPPPQPAAANPYSVPPPPFRPAPPSAAAPAEATAADPFRPVSAPVTPLASAVPANASLPLPVGAIVLIGLGILFLLGNTRWLGELPVHIFLPVALIALGVWLFVRRLLSFGAGFTDDGTPAYQLRVVSALQGSIWVVLVGILFLLDSLRILSWGRSWPLFIIVAGVVIFLRRSATSSLAQAQVPVYPIGQAVPPAPFTEPTNPTDSEQR